MNELHLDEATRVVLLDIEGTTTPIDFVYQTLFPYARRHLRHYLTQHHAAPEVQADLNSLRAEYETDLAQSGAEALPAWPVNDASLDGAIGYLEWLMQLDRKATPLKSLQGKIWEAGYRSGELCSEVFADVPSALERWHAQGKQVCIYSSGSVLAQKQLFGNTVAGDLTRFLSGYFDTGVGPKRETESYQAIANALQVTPANIVFISDVTAELAAARAAGMQPLLATRPGNPPQPDADAYPCVSSFADLWP